MCVHVCVCVFTVQSAAGLSRDSWPSPYVCVCFIYRTPLLYNI